MRENKQQALTVNSKNDIYLDVSTITSNFNDIYLDVGTITSNFNDIYLDVSTITSNQSDDSQTISTDFYGVFDDLVKTSNIYIISNKFKISPEIEKFIEKENKPKEIVENILWQIYNLVYLRKDFREAIFDLNKVNEKVEGDIYFSGNTIGSFIDLKNKIDDIIFNESEKISNMGKRIEAMKLFDITLFDIKNGIRI